MEQKMEQKKDEKTLSQKTQEEMLKVETAIKQTQAYLEQLTRTYLVLQGRLQAYAEVEKLAQPFQSKESKEDKKIPSKKEIKK